MVVACRTQQLLKTGKNVNISKKFSFSTGNVSLGFRNYVDRNTVPLSEKSRVRLCDCKKFHSSRESRTTLAKLTPQELFNCDGTESRRLRPNNDPVVDVDNSLLNRPDVKRTILDYILQNRGTSVDQIHEKIGAADGNLELAVSEINSELKSDILKIDGELIKVNSENLKSILKDAAGAVIRDKLAENPILASVIEKGVNEQVASESERLNQVIENSAVPLDVAKEFLEKHKQNRNKRSLQPRDFDLGSIINDIVLNVLQNQLSSIISNLLETVKNLLLQFYTSTPPTNDLQKIIAFAVNTVIDRVVEVITLLQNAIKGPTTTDTTDNPAVSRRKRAAEDETAVETAEEAGGLLDGIIGPVLNLLASVLSPVNSLLKGLVSTILNLLRPVLGSLIVTPISNVINSIIDLLIPTNTI
ncbi:uncharacterized protein BDFB_010306 [Asbolus verrucosus]|uniref:Uncharacterized protein n=1 Tax=Asbolus verrucosus TaxID=1661398 RepID=A0A482VDA1_ASBVE|nr:uncharacterized protein BDFB_010306 [Asbolus verrucosus]